ncbi:MAG: DUF885 domain-containing protein [Verrucomicrobia bacterium]|nr:DUF885 domain-containing protein [Verrucomicrobiota bacterium]MBI3869195.1 DUF885 domain-containing protein [Verrucomicrobiota bacterium]
MNASSRKFEGILDRHFETLLEHQPIFATYAGLKSGEGDLGVVSEAFEAAQQKRRLATIRALDGVNPRELSGEQHLDRLALRSQLLRDCEDHHRGRRQMDPSALDSLLNLLLHELQRGDDEPSRAAANIRSLLRKAPDYLDASLALIRKPEPVWRRILDRTFQGSPSLFAAVAEFLKRHRSHESDARLLTSASRAGARYHRGVMRRPAAPEGSFAIGGASLARRVRDELGLDYSLGEIESLAESEAERLRRQLKSACRRFGAKKSADEIVAEAREAWDPGEDLLAVYRAETRRVAGAFRSSKAVTFPEGESLEVRMVPEFMRHLYPTAAYSSPGPFARKQRGIFWVNDLSLTQATEEAKRRERQQHFGLSLTCAHEAYPGHHLQFILANQHPRRWRRLFAHAVFYEGWTLWCEQMMVDLRIDRSSWLPIQQLHDALWRAHRVVVDLRLQTGRYTYEQAARHLRRHLGFTRARAEADVNWYTASPGVPMSYWLGRLENERLQRRLMTGRGWSLRRFNDWLLSFGTLPQSWIEKHGLE